MSVTVVVNYMTVSHKGSSGMSIAFPDICKTPILGVPVPIPYPNIAMSSDLKKGSKKVKCDGKKVVLKSSKIKRSMGDEPGVQKGLISNKQMGKAKFANYSFDVKFEGKNVCRLADPTTQNRGTINTAAFCHIQKPDSVKGPNADVIKDACAEVKDKGEKQKKKKDSDPGKGGPASSGILKEHWDAMQKYLSQNPLWMLYFRKTGEDCEEWIRAEHEPKPHSVLDGNCLKASKPELIEAAQVWIAQNQRTAPSTKAANEQLIKIEWKDGVEGLEVSKLYGIVVRTGENRGKPQMAITEPFMSERKWMTGDYDLMDVLMAEAQCQRLAGWAFGLLQMELNGAMGWPGIQHPWQTAWNTRKDKDFKADDKKQVYEFNVLSAMDTWMSNVTAQTKNGPAAKKAAARQRPVAIFAEGRDPSELIDDKLTVLAPKGGLYLDNPEDYFDALACSGCLDEKIEHKQTQEELQTTRGKVERKQGKELDYDASIKGDIRPQGGGQS